MLLRDGKNRTRDLLVADLYKGQLGTGDTAPTEDDTALEAADATTLLTVTSSSYDKQLVVDYTLNSVTGNGSTYKEYEIQLNSGTDKLIRITFPSYTKDSDEELQISTIVNIL